MIVGLLAMTVSKPEGYTLKISSNIIRRSLKDCDLSQNPNVSFWQIGKIFSYRLFGLEMRREKNLAKEAEERHFSK